MGDAKPDRAASDWGCVAAAGFGTDSGMISPRSATILACLALAAVSGRAQEAFPQSRPDHHDLTWFRDEAGGKQPIQTPADWEKRRAEIVKSFEIPCGPLPSRESLPDLDIQTSETIETDQYTRHAITFQSEPGDRTPAYLYVPKGIAPGERRAGIVALHPTGPLGKGITDGQGPRPNRAYAKELAERGHVVIAPDYPSFGDIASYDFAKDRYQSGTMKGIWNHLRCVDVLVARADVDPEKIASIGHSLGGHNAIFHAVFDTRVKVVVSSCGWTPMHDYYGGKLDGWTSDRYVPAIRTDFGLDPDRVPFDYYGLIAALAPRAFFSNSPLRDSNFDYRGVEKAAPRVRRIYELLGVPDELRIAYPDSDHDFVPEVREEAYRFIESRFATGH